MSDPREIFLQGENVNLDALLEYHDKRAQSADSFYRPEQDWSRVTAMALRELRDLLLDVKREAPRRAGGEGGDMTLLEQWDKDSHLACSYRYNELRRALAIAQAVEEFKIDGYAQQIMRRADELLTAKEQQP